MAGVSVTIESLKNVKRALSDFQTDIDSVTDKINSSTEQILVEIKQSIKKQENIVTAISGKVSSLINEIEQIQEDIISLNMRIKSLKTEISNLEKQKLQLKMKVHQLEQQKQKLLAQKNNDQNDVGGIKNQIRAIETQIQNCWRTQNHINDQISIVQQRLTNNERRCTELKKGKTTKEGELSAAKSDLNRSKSKLERLSLAGDSVERELTNLSIAVKKFGETASASNTTSKAGVNKCIAEIEEYLAVSLGGTGNQEGAANNAFHNIDESSGERTFPYASSEEMSDAVFDLVREYQTNGVEWNLMIRAGGTTDEIDNFRELIQQNHLSINSHFTRRATFADMGQELQGLQPEELVGRSYTFTGIMSASRAGWSGFAPGNVIYEISAPVGTSVLDLTNLVDFQEAMFDSPICHINSVVQPQGSSTTVVYMTVE